MFRRPWCTAWLPVQAWGFFFSKEKEEGYGDDWRRRVLLQWDSHHRFKSNEPGQSISLNGCHGDSMLGVSWSLRRLIRSQVHWVILRFLQQLTPQSSPHFIVTCKKKKRLPACLSFPNNQDKVVNNSKQGDVQNVAEDNSVTDIQPFPPSFFFLFIKLHKPEYRRRKKWLLSAVWMSLHLPDWILLHQINMRTFANTILLWYNRDTCKSLPFFSLLTPGSSVGFFLGHFRWRRKKKKKKKKKKWDVIFSIILSRNYMQDFPQTKMYTIMQT